VIFAIGLAVIAIVLTGLAIIIAIGDEAGSDD